VLPERPAGTQDWDRERLASLVTRDSLIGVARALEPEALALAIQSA
jgi:nitrile hydratase